MYKVVDGGWCQKEKRYKEMIEVKLIVRRQSQLGQFYLAWT